MLEGGARERIKGESLGHVDMTPDTQPWPIEEVEKPATAACKPLFERGGAGGGAALEVQPDGDDISEHWRSVADVRRCM